MSERMKIAIKNFEHTLCLFHVIQAISKIERQTSQATLTDNQIQRFHSELKKKIGKNVSNKP